MDDANRDLWSAELANLFALPGTPTPVQRRRIAELVEALHGEDEAWKYWTEAALAGDPDARDYLIELIEERTSP
jgi:hypothetical protein